MGESYTIGSGAPTACVSSLGAELVSIADVSGAEWMADGGPAFWSGRLPTLFPVVGELAGRVMRVDGALDMGFPDCPMLAIWQKPGADFVCLEPRAEMADPVDFDGEFREKPGVMELSPGNERSFRVALNVRHAATGG